MLRVSGYVRSQRHLGSQEVLIDIISDLSLYPREMKAEVQAYLKEIGRRGGQRSRRVLSPEEARNMVRVREARRLYRRFHDRCFWDAPSDFTVGREDLGWVEERLRQHGGREGWEAATRLCR